MPRRFHKHKLLLDENMARRQEFPSLNERFDVKHVRDDLHHGGDADPAVYQLAVEQKRIVVTVNGRDFRDLVQPDDEAGVIDVPANWPRSHVDTKLTALLMRHGQRYFIGYYRSLATEADAS